MESIRPRNCFGISDDLFHSTASREKVKACFNVFGGVLPLSVLLDYSIDTKTAKTAKTDEFPSYVLSDPYYYYDILRKSSVEHFKKLFPTGVKFFSSAEEVLEYLETFNS